MFTQNNFTDSIFSGLVSLDQNASSQFQPRLVTNDYSTGRKTLEFILDNLTTCETFRFAVAFLTRSGVACLHQALKDFGERGGEGEILISTYLNFSDPFAIKALSKFEGISVKFVNEPNFHGKTYLFEHKDYAQLMVGSSNLTQNALGKNTEVNLGISIQRNSGLYIQTASQFDAWCGRSIPTSDENIQDYWENWNRAKQNIKQSSFSHPTDEINPEIEANKIDQTHTDDLTPNMMQVPALKRLEVVRREGHTRSLIISATGTGKTVLSAFDVKQFNTKRLLFVVHRLNIAKKAMSEFRRVFGASKTMGLYSAGDSFNEDADFVFSTVQTINSDRHLNKFSPDDFDYIIIDETHRAGAVTYKRVIDYFNPKFLLGMTATPERTDGFDIFALFNHNIAYEIRLQKAMEAELLSPFHYFGVTDILVNGEALDEKSDFGKLISSDRVDHIIKTIDEYGCDTGNVRGLIFCSRVEEARELSNAFNFRGYKTLSITGSDTEKFREDAIQRLEASDDTKIDYIFTVDVFNEGVDIPKINQVVMLRPTTSAIIFVQQLGRGLRKAPNKDYVTVIDFIGNYQNNYLIPLALFGDSSHNKDRLRRLLGAGSSLIPGASSISFEKIAREQIFASIDTVKLNNKKGLTEDFNLLRFRLGRLPLMIDFIQNESRDPYQYIEYSGSLLGFTNTIENNMSVPKAQLKLLEYLSKHVCDGIRLEEGVILSSAIENDQTSFKTIKNKIFDIAGYKPSNEVIFSAIHNINLHFVTERSANQNLRVSEVSKFEILIHDISSESIKIGETLENTLKDEIFSNYLKDLTNASNKKFLSDFDINNFVDGFKRGSKYTRKDVFRILKWDKLPNAQNVGGYIVSPEKSNCPVFVNYQKEDHISETTKYEDRFINPSHVVYMSKNRRSISSPDVAAMMNHESLGMRMPFFVKKNNDEGLGFYYLGEMMAIKDKFVDTTMSGDDSAAVSVVKMEFMLDRDVDYRLYKYLTSNHD